TIIRAGVAVETGTLAQLRHLTRTSVSAEVAVPADEAGAGVGVLDGLAALPGVHGPVISGDSGTRRLSCQVETAALNHLVRRLTTVGIASLTCRPPTLEELFLRHYAGAGPHVAGTGS